jgi:hypothetical protein
MTVNRLFTLPLKTLMGCALFYATKIINISINIFNTIIKMGFLLLNLGVHSMENNKGYCAKSLMQAPGLNKCNTVKKINYHGNSK